VRLPRNVGIATGAYERERDDWAAAIARADREEWRFVELTAIRWDRLETLAEFLRRGGGELDGFERVSLHAPLPTPDASARRIVDRLEGLPTDFDVVFHPDGFRDEPSLGRLGSRVVFENMDVQKAFGRDVDDVAAVLDALPEAGFCLDVAHVWTNDRSLRIGHDLLDRFGERLRQVHVSGIEPNGTHRPTTPADWDLYLPLLERCADVPWLLEAELAA
jgi:hypothetical protein